MASVQYDKEANAMYIRLTSENKKVQETIAIGENRFVDVDESGTAIGLEIILPKQMPREFEEIIFRSKKEIELIQ
ncbi:MAG: DUF2283 domain-containing protein [Nitrosotalea sp.]